jgi:hypothetical protein
MSKMLKFHKCCAPHSAVTTSWKIQQEFIVFDFFINNYNAFTNSQFGQDYKNNWGLWDYDVVEVFIKKEDSDSYLELQTSPLNQKFALIVQIPREKYYSPEKCNFVVSNVVENKQWHATMSIPLDVIPGQSRSLTGNCFACLGAQDKREYFALNINSEDSPDFHRPDLFINLGDAP